MFIVSITQCSETGEWFPGQYVEGPNVQAVLSLSGKANQWDGRLRGVWLAVLGAEIGRGGNETLGTDSCASTLFCTVNCWTELNCPVE